MAFLVLAAAVTGLVVGSFLNVVVGRVPRGESIVHPRSRCPVCQGAIGARDNVPVVSWLMLRGRCRNCHARISWRYPFVEIGCALLFVVITLRFGLAPELPAYLYLVAVGLALALIDVEVRRLPNALTLPSYVVGGVLLGLAAVLGGSSHDFIRAGLGMVALYAFYFLLALAYPAGMGFGDVKLAGVLGLYLGYLGWGVLAVGAFLGFGIGAIGGVTLMALHRASRKSAVPFGPYMLAGALVAVLAGQRIADAYLRVTLG